MPRPFRQVDVFSPVPFQGNPLAVVLDADGIDSAGMQRFARWMNLSETAFVSAPEAEGADYQVRIFTPTIELPFAGHPTLGACHAWLEAGNSPAGGEEIVQQCQAGLIRIRRAPGGLLGFAAPPLVRSGPVEEDLLVQVAAELGVGRDQIAAAQWADNGPGWLAVLLGSAGEVLALRPPAISRDVGVAGPYPPGSECAFEVRAFFMQGDKAAEDPVTGSLNASLAQWLFASGQMTGPYVVSQGTAVGRSGRVRLEFDSSGQVWVAGATITRISGDIDL